MYKQFLIDPKNPEDYRIICQDGVRQTILPKSTHNASWDSILTSDGRLFLSLCSELTTSEYAKLAEYVYDENRIIEHFYTKDYIMPHERYIRDSKFHTCMAEMENGDLIMATHTTDKAPDHPAWMPEAYYHSIWEGYPGSTLFIYRKDGKVENLGIPAPRESIYGAVYDKKHKNYYMLGFMRGHLYCYNINTRKTVDLGQVTERHTYRLIVGADSNIYFSTRSGSIQRLNVDTQDIEDTGVLLPNSCDEKKLPRSYFASAVNGPDGKIYIAGQFHDELSVYDPVTNVLENMGPYKPAKEYTSGTSNNDYVGGMAFDKNGVLWLVLCALRHDKEEDYKPPCSLIRWDILNGQKPEFCGIVGTEKRILTTTVGVHYDKDKNVLYLVGTNYADEGVDVTALDLTIFDQNYREKGEISKDPFIYPGNTKHSEHADNLRRTWNIIGRNPANFLAKKIIPVRIWKLVNSNEIDRSAVLEVGFEEDKIYAIFDNGNRIVRLDKNGTVLSVSENNKKLKLQSPAPAENLPYYPGRQYKAVSALSVELCDGRRLTATEDGILALVSDTSTFALGPVSSNGKVRDMAVNKEGTKVYGVAGDEDDLGMVFSFDFENGLRMHGRLCTDGPEYGNAASCLLTSCALSDDSKTLVIGAGDRLGCVYICSL